MLPDLPQLRERVTKTYMDYIRHRANNQLGVFSESPRRVIHEGDRASIKRADGSQEPTALIASNSASHLTQAEAENLTGGRWLQTLNELADGLAQDMATKLHESLAATLDREGRTINGNGRGFSPDILFEVFQSLDIDFDVNGRPRMPTISIHPNQQSALLAVFAEIDADPAKLERWRDLFLTKWMDWRDREASRRLVG